MNEPVLSPQIRQVMEALEANNMTAHYLPRADQVVDFVQQLIPEGALVSNGGSVTLVQTGVMDHLAGGRYRYLDRSKVSGEELARLYRQVFSADWYLASANAITQQGEIYELDANANRIAAISFGPAHVLLIAGVNKIVPDLHAAVRRVRETVAPRNAVRLGLKTPCALTGQCADCKSPDRICCSALILRRQREAFKGRIHVLLVGEELGY